MVKIYVKGRVSRCCVIDTLRKKINSIRIEKCYVGFCGIVVDCVKDLEYEISISVSIYTIDGSNIEYYKQRLYDSVVGMLK